MTERNEDEQPLKFTTVPTSELMMSPVPARDADNTPLENRAIPADSRPEFDTTAWPEDTTRLAGVTIRRAPVVASRADSKGWVQRYDGKEILLESWYGPDASVALWLTPEGRYPTTVYPVASRATAHDLSESVEKRDGNELHVQSFRITTRDQPTEYHVTAYWQIQEKMWLMVSARSKSRTGQEILLAMIRTANSPPHTSVAVQR